MYTTFAPHCSQALQELNNFAGIFMVNAALESAAVYRLKHTFKVRVGPLFDTIHNRMHNYAVHVYD